MPTLKEIKGRIASVKSTLKITSAMKLVASAKLRKAQKAIEAMRPYEEQLQRMLTAVGGGATLETAKSLENVSSGTKMPDFVRLGPENASSGTKMPDFVRLEGERPMAIIAVASNSSLCGGFNAAAIAKVRSVRRRGDVVYSIGRKMADAMRKDGFPSPEDYTALAEHPAYAPAAELVENLSKEVDEGRLAGVVLVYNHFVSTAKQEPVVEELISVRKGDAFSGASAFSLAEEKASPSDASEIIIEPSRKELLAALLPKTLKLKFYSALLDSAAAEHAARTVAMQTATDNGENLLAELTLQYNKGRQQKITSEILDLAGGQQD